MLIHLLTTNTQVYASSLAKAVDCTYSHVVKVLQQMERENLISFKKIDRRKIITLTTKGKKIALGIDEIRKNL